LGLLQIRDIGWGEELLMTYLKRSFNANDFLNVEYCLIEGVHEDDQEIKFQVKNLSTDAITEYMRMRAAYQQIKGNAD
jgi:ABC-type transporter lipoprotein component MlaA